MEWLRNRPGIVLVNSGTLGGDGNIGGAVTIESGSGVSAYLAPGLNGSGRIRIHKSLIFTANGIYSCDLNARNRRIDQVRAASIAIESGAQFFINTVSVQALPCGKVFTLMENASDSPIGGIFANLGDGSTLHAVGNTFRVSYEGGDGNDLTLTVML